MDSEKVGKLISRLRRKKGFTQQALGDKLGVSYKTISKWECGKGLPDISMLKEISLIFGITTDELLSGELKVKDNDEFNIKNNNNKKRLFLIILVMCMVILGYFIYNSYDNKDDVDDFDCTVIRTYYIDSIGKSNDSNYLYITVHEFQVEGTYTLKLSRLISEKLEVGKSYEITFKVNYEYIDVTTDILFNQGEVLNIEYTDKEGLDRISKYYCDKEMNSYE